MIGSGNLIGTQLGNYAIQGLLGAGGMASVYRGFDQNLRRPVAIKVLSDTAAAQPGFAERFRQEARLIASLRHPHIVQIYDFGDQDGYTYMVQELLPGPTLQQRLQELAANGQQPARQEVLEIVAQLASALDAAHAAGIIHRDVKPANAIWNAGRALVLTDFGIAKNTQLALDQTQAGVVIGTPDYLSPEQAQGLPLTPSSDIYALGVVLYELLAGSLPFTGGTALGVAMGHIHDAPPPLRNQRPDLPPAVEAVVQQALAKDPATRFRTAGLLAQALERAWPASAVSVPGATGLHDQPTRVWEGAAARPAPQPDQVLTRPKAAPAAPRPVAPPRRRAQSLPLVVGTLLAALAIAGIVLIGRGAGQPAAAIPAAPAAEATPVPAQPTAAPAAEATPLPEPTALPQPTTPPTPEPQPTAAPVADSRQIDQLRASIAAASADGRAGKDAGAMLDDLDKAKQALADGNQKRATDRLRDLQKRLVEGVKDEHVDADFARQALAGIDAIADTYGLKLPPIKQKGG